MDDLIRRQALIADIFKLKCLTTKSKEWFAEIVKKQPTAYDVDKVVEKLEEKADEAHDGYNPVIVQTFRRAIEIVKEDGKDE